MTDQEMRIAIAEACGWESIRERAGTCEGLIPGIAQDIYKALPDYLNDLNAMHEAEKMLVGDCLEYVRLICNLSGGVGWHASARQRAKAFLKTIGKL